MHRHAAREEGEVEEEEEGGGAAPLGIGREEHRPQQEEHRREEDRARVGGLFEFSEERIAALLEGLPETCAAHSEVAHPSPWKIVLFALVGRRIRLCQPRNGSNSRPDSNHLPGLADARGSFLPVPRWARRLVPRRARRIRDGREG